MFVINSYSLTTVTIVSTVYGQLYIVTQLEIMATCIYVYMLTYTYR